ncbi:MAG: hypothetical protein Q8Q38_03160 [bacterium]|nr:hypothetical protein [bacterium]
MTHETEILTLRNQQEGQPEAAPSEGGEETPASEPASTPEEAPSEDGEQSAPATEETPGA